ncbi:MAG: hydroxymethylbilane synthase [Terracidiphilus sp.]
MKLRIGSRGSQLALWQANHVAELLREQGHEVGIEIIRTTGDRLQDVTFAQVGSKGMFTKEIEEALARGRIDLAVHSLKDLPTELPEPFALAATPARVDARDVLVSVEYARLAEMPRGARVGTSSQRRRAQLRVLRPDIETVEFRGNVDTRLRKLGEGQVDAILLAAAGLDRLGKADLVKQRFEPRDFCPAAGQGALGIETRKDDTAREAVAFLDDADTRFAVTAERAALAALGGGCQVPIGVHCRTSFAEDGSGGAWWEIFGVVASPTTGQVVRVHLHAPRENSEPESLGREAAEVLIEEGAGPLIEAAGEVAGGAA